MRLTDISVRAFAPPEKGQKIYFDDTFPNFGCRVSQGGTRSFVVQHGANRQLITLGRYPVLSLSKARDLAYERLAEITLGKHRPKSIAWDDAVALFLEECGRQNKPRTVNDYTRLLKRHFAFGRRRLSEITYDDINRRISRLNDTPSEQNHALVAVKVFLSWAKRPPRRYIDQNPAEGMVRTERPSRSRVLSDPELAAVFSTAVAGADTFSFIVALLILLGQRPGEIGALKLSYLDEQERTITLPGAVTKNGRTHTFPYGDLAARILESIPRIGEEYLFPASREHVRGKPTTSFAGWAKAKIAFDKRVQEKAIVAPYQLRDLRRTAATNWARLGVAPHVVEKLLNHTFGSIINQTNGVVSAVAEVYNRHAYMDEMRDAIRKWEARLTSLLNA